MHRPSPPLPHSRELQVGSSQMEPAGCSCGCAHCRNHCSTPASALSTWHPSTTSKPFHFFFFFNIVDTGSVSQWQYLQLVGKLKLLTGSRLRGKRTQLVKCQQQNPAGQIYPLQLQGAMCGHPACSVCCATPKTSHTHRVTVLDLLFSYSWLLLPSLQLLCLAPGSWFVPWSRNWLCFLPKAPQ